MLTNANILQPIADYLQLELIGELRDQGHIATGDLISSVKVEVEQEINKWSIVGSSLFYGTYVDRGRPAGIKKVPISALIKWIIQKRFESDKKKIRSMAFAIQYNIWKNGIKNPRKLGWVTKTLEDNEIRIKADLTLIIRKQLEISILNMIQLTNKKMAS